MAGVEDEDEFKDASAGSDPPISSPLPTSKPAAAAGGSGLGRRLFASIPLPASLSAAIGRFSSPKPPASNVGLGLLLHAGPAFPADGNGSPARDAASAISTPYPPPLASLQRHCREDQVAGLGAGVGEDELGLLPAEEQGRPAAEGRENEDGAVDGCSANRNDFYLLGQEEEGEQCQGDELGVAVDGCMVQDQEVAVVEQEGATEDCAAVVEDQSNNASVEECAGDETRAATDDNAMEVNENVTEREGAVSILDAAEDGVAVGLQEEEDVVVAEQGEDAISVQDQLDMVEQCTADQSRTTMDDNAAQDQDFVEQEEATKYYAALEDIESCTNDGPKAVKDNNIVEEEERAVEQEVAVSILDATEDGVAVGSQEEEDVVVAEQGEDAISVQHQLQMVEQCTGDQMRTTTDDSAAQDQDLVEQEEATKYYTALEAVGQCTNDGSKAVKDGNIVEEEERVVEKEGAVGILDATKDSAPVESQEEDVVVADQNEDGISVQDQHKVVGQCTSDQLIISTDDNAAQDKYMVEQEGATEYFTALEAVEQCINDGSRAVKDVNVVEEKEEVEQEVDVGVLDAATDCATMELQKEVMVAEQSEDDISVQDQHKVVEQCTDDQLKATPDDNATQDQEVLEQEGATEYYTALKNVEECTNDGSRSATDGNVVEEKERVVKQGGALGVLNTAKDNFIVEWKAEGVVVAEHCEDDISVQDQHKVVKQCTSGQLRATMDDNAAEGQEEVEQECAIVERDAIIDAIAVEDQEKGVKQSAGDESRATEDENVVGLNKKMAYQEDGIDEITVIKDESVVELLEENHSVVVEQGGDTISLPDEGNVVEQYTSDQLRTTMDDNAAENQETGEEQEGAILERVITTDDIDVGDQEKEVEQSAGDESTATKDEKVDQEDGINKQIVIKDDSGVDLQEEHVVVSEQGGDEISVRDVVNVVKQRTDEQLRTTMEDNTTECQEAVEQEGAVVERAVTADGLTVEDQDKEVEQSAGDESRGTKDENAVENNKKVVCQEDAIDTQGAANDCSGVELQDEEDVVDAKQGGVGISVRDEGNVVEQYTSDQHRTSTDNNVAEDQVAVEQAVVSILGAAKVDIAVESRDDIVVAEQVEDGVSVQDQEKVTEQCTSDQLRTSMDGYAVDDHEAIREKIGSSARYPQRPGKLNCRFYMSTGSCSYGSSCHFNHPQLKVRMEVSNFPSEQRNREVEFLELNRVGLPIREGARKCTYYMHNGTCRYGKKCCFNHPEQVLDVQQHMPTGWDDTTLQSSPHSKNSAEHATINDLSSGSEILPPNILRMLLPPQNVPPCTEEKEMKVKKDPDWSSASDNSDGCCSADSSDGPLCKQEHVDYPERHECPFLRRFGNCKFASSCQYYHPKDRFPSRYNPKDKIPSRCHSNDNSKSGYRSKKDPPLAELKSYPDRPGGPECPFYMKTGSCKFGADCKFHHPKDLTPSLQSPSSPKRSVASNEHHPAAKVTLQDHMFQQQKCPKRPGQPDCRYYMQFGKCKFQSACIFNHPKDRLSSRWHPAECPFYMKTGTCQFGSACEFYHPKDRCSSTGEAIDDGTDYEHDFFTKSENARQQQEKTLYPERSGELECSHYMKHGYCKFHMSCKFHHPTDRLSKE